MPKLIKYTLIALAALLGLLAAAIAVISATVNPNNYKPQIIELVREKTQRTLLIPGDIRLTFFPSLGADLGKFSLSEQRKSEVFASATHGRVAVALLPLLTGQVMVDRVGVDGLTVNLQRYKNNSTNYDDLTGKSKEASTAPASPSPKSKAVQLDLGGITMTEARLSYLDDTKGSKHALYVKKLITGPLTSGKKGKLELDLELSSPAIPTGKMTLQANGQAALDLEQERVHANLKGKLDSTTFDVQLDLQRFTQSSYNFNIALGDLDVDRYLASNKPAPAETSAKSAGADPVIDLSPLKTLNAKGTLKIEKLKVANIRSADIKLDVNAAGGKLNVAPLAATLYGGAVSGALSVNAGNTGSTQNFTSKLDLRGIQIGPLLKDAMGKDPLDGKGDVSLDVLSSGSTVSQLKKGLNGSAKLALKDGSVKGLNIAAALRSSNSGEQKTDFSEMTASFKIKNGIAHNDDLDAKSPLLRLGGAGDINIGESNLDYTAKATIVSSLEGQGGAQAQAIKGLTIPVRLSGPFTNVAWKIDMSAGAGGQVKADSLKRLDEGKAQVQDKLKGLFGR